MIADAADLAALASQVNGGYIDFMKGKISDDENVFQCEKIDTSNASEFLAENGGLVYMTCDESVHEDCFGAIALSSNPEQAAAHIDSADRSFDVTALVFGGAAPRTYYTYA